MNSKMLASAIMGAALFQSPTFADPTPNPAAYFGGSPGDSEYKDNPRVDSELGKIYGGPTLNNNLALEAEWIRLDKFDFPGDKIESDSTALSVVYVGATYIF